MSTKENSKLAAALNETESLNISEETYQLVETLSTAGVEISSQGGKLAFKADKGVMTTELMNRLRSQKTQLLLLLSEDDADRGGICVLPLSELQQSYWIGEAGEVGVAGADHWYNQFEVETLDLDTLKRALAMLIERHDYLRSYITEDGFLTILDKSYSFSFEYIDHSGLSLTEEKTAVQKIKDEMCRPISANQWPLYRMYVQQLSGSFRVHVCGRLLIGDAASWQLYADELGLLLEDTARDDLSDPQSLSVAMLNQFRQRLSKEYQMSRQYWLSRKLPTSPALPIHSVNSKFSRLIGDFDDAITNALAAKARENGLTLDSVFMTLYALVLDIWSQESRFSINVLHGNKRHTGFPLGNFGSILKLEIDLNRDHAFAEIAKSIRKQFLQDMAHAAVDGVKAQRMSNHHAEFSGTASQVAYSSGFGIGRPSKAEIGLAQIGWEPNDAYLQTPGVILDFQAFYTVDGIRVHFDVDCGRLGEDVANAMFSSLRDAVINIAAMPNWNETLLIDLPKDQLASISQANATQKQQTLHYLHELVAKRLDDGQGIALKTDELTLSYSTLSEYVDKMVLKLVEDSINVQHPIAVVAKKGWQQIVATIAIVKAGGSYVPIDPSWPATRIASVLNRIGCECIVADQVGYASIQREALDHGRANYLIDQVVVAGMNTTPHQAQIEKDKIAYVIFTSGSTGEPKGVAISHCAAANTIEDMINRFDITSNDSVLGVSALHFDLSVFDIFAVLGVGGKLVLPPDCARPDPEELFNLVLTENITLWNTVPAIMEMVVEYALPRQLTLSSLRCIFMSGDWIPVDLPAKLRRVCPNARLIGLGGATEASIWSNWFEIDRIPDGWKSVPYGKALANQALYVVDRYGAFCPDWVEGDLVIGGQGLAQTYWGLPDETAARFVSSKFDGQRIYITGDRARRWPDGNIEFLGRIDSQIKLNGYRVELGEVASALKQCTGVENAVAVPVDLRGRKGIAGFVTPATLNIEEIREALYAKLPSYMIPAQIFSVDAIPLTANGKVDQKKLGEIASESRTNEHVSAPEGRNEMAMAELWRKVLQYDIEDNGIGFVDAGGDSLLAIRLINLIEQRFGVRPSITDIFREPTIKGMAAVLNRRDTPASNALIPLRVKEHNKIVVVLVHPVGGTTYCYKPLIDASAQTISFYGLQSLGINSENYTLTQLAELYVNELQNAGIQPSHIVGWSFGGVVAGEMQKRFKQRTHALIPITMIDPWVRANDMITIDDKTMEVSFVCDVLFGERECDRDEIKRELQTKSMFELLKSNDGSVLGKHVDEADITTLFQQFKNNTQALLGYDCVPPEQATIWIAEAQQASGFPHLSRLTQVHVQLACLNLDADHYSIISGDHLKSIASVLNEQLNTGGAL
ncbi:amino acid adenylation domain-containing protein [Thalassolituus maritimus]|uniref:Amino acid adenylation domain-containing protein n=1 Tax=Thalassolituus maritimus TaxID=484498 RepID=A0A1N7Q955_9GAMM|nr:non-ribosomal peptide synthetase [Thalassolituus maritimus]SIT19383.1 amino acid adenylation domain-containing protein [Thalassolituus maritimus]